jgi:hypothetical protein
LRELLTRKVADATSALAKARGKKSLDYKTYRHTWFGKMMPLWRKEKKKQGALHHPKFTPEMWELQD